MRHPPSCRCGGSGRVPTGCTGLAWGWCGMTWDEQTLARFNLVSLDDRAQRWLSVPILSCGDRPRIVGEMRIDPAQSQHLVSDNFVLSHVVRGDGRLISVVITPTHPASYV